MREVWAGGEGRGEEGQAGAASTAPRHHTRHCTCPHISQRSFLCLPGEEVQSMSGREGQATPGLQRGGKEQRKDHSAGSTDPAASGLGRSRGQRARTRRRKPWRVPKDVTPPPTGSTSWLRRWGRCQVLGSQRRELSLAVLRCFLQPETPEAVFLRAEACSGPGAGDRGCQGPRGEPGTTQWQPRAAPAQWSLGALSVALATSPAAGNQPSTS